MTDITRSCRPGVHLGNALYAGVTFVQDVDLAAFQKATTPVYKAFPKWTPGLHDRVTSILQK